MAKIDEERILLRFSTIIRDEEEVTGFTILDEDTRVNIETFADTFLQEKFLSSNIQISVLVEANILPFGSNI